ncbi:MAG: TolC family protein, partial [Bacteroidota bacterium]
MPRLLRLAAAVALLAPAVGAQDVPRGGVPPGGTITLDEAVEIAVGQSPEVRRGVLADDSRALAVSDARTGRLPSISASLAPTQRYGLAFDQTIGDVVTQTSETLNLGVGGSIRLYDGGRVSADVRRARLEREAASVGLERTRQQVATDVAQQFLQLLLDRELVEVQTEQLTAAEAQLERVRELVEAGARPRGDLITQESVVAARRTDLIVAQGAVDRTEVVLVQLVGLDPLGDYTFVGPSLDALEAAGLFAYEPEPLAALIDAARAARTDLQAQEIQIRAAEAGIGSARAGGLPSLDLDASYGTGYSSLQRRSVGEAPSFPVTLPDGTPILVGGDPLTFPGDPTLETTPVFTQFGDNRGGSVGLTLRVPIFDRFQTRRAVAEARIRADDARIQLDALDRQVASEVQQAVVEARTAAARLEAAEAQLAAATEALRVERDRYALGAGTLYEVAEQQARLAEAASGRAQAAYGLVFRIALVRLAVGDVAVEDLAETVV